MLRPFRLVFPVFLLGALAAAAAETTIPKDIQVAVRTLDAIHSKDSAVGQNYPCTLEAPIQVDGKAIVPKGADCILRIAEMKKAGKLTGNNELQLILAEIRVDGELVPVNSSRAEIKGKGKGKGTGWRAGLGAAAGAGLGAAIGGARGAAIGAGAGAGAGAASSALTSGPEIRVAPETVLTFQIQ